MKRKLALVLTVMMVLATMIPAASLAEAKSLFFCPKCVGYDYWTAAQKGVEEGAAELGYKAVFNGPATTDSAQQITMIEDYIAQGISGLAIAPNDAEAIADTIETAISKGINTITFDTDAPNSTRSYYVGPDSDYNMGEQLAQMIADQMGGSGKLAFMVASFSAENQVAKVEGATDYLKKNYPNIEIVTTLNSDDTNEKAFQNAQTLLTTYPDLKGILGFAGAEAPQAAAAVTQAIENGEVKEGQIAITGIGFPSQSREYIKSGVLPQVLTWNPQQTGKVGVYVLAAMEEGKDIASVQVPDTTLKIDGTNIYHGCIVLNKDNIDDYTFA
jgi:rhamnose transport system substrate-binding protein